MGRTRFKGLSTRRRLFGSDGDLVGQKKVGEAGMSDIYYLIFFQRKIVKRRIGIGRPKGLG